jgi:hypothetical protein
MVQFGFTIYGDTSISNKLKHNKFLFLAPTTPQTMQARDPLARERKGGGQRGLG